MQESACGCLNHLRGARRTGLPLPPPSLGTNVDCSGKLVVAMLVHCQHIYIATVFRRSVKPEQDSCCFVSPLLLEPVLCHNHAHLRVLRTHQTTPPYITFQQICGAHSVLRPPAWVTKYCIVHASLPSFVLPPKGLGLVCHAFFLDWGPEWPIHSSCKTGNNRY